jgi:hypothetical protein
MGRGSTNLWLLLALAILLTGCGGEDADTAGGGADDGPAAAPPTKEAVIVVLRELHGALVAKDFDRAVSHLVEFPNITEEARKAATAGFIDEREISQAGIDILAEKGKFGPLKEVCPERGARWAEYAGVPIDRCYGISYEGAEVAVIQKGEALLLIRLDDVGKLQ